MLFPSKFIFGVLGIIQFFLKLIGGKFFKSGFKFYLNLEEKSGLKNFRHGSPAPL